MSWVKQCDRTYTRKKAAVAGLTGMGFWSACMGQSAHEELDGRLEPDDLEQAWTRGYGADAALWGGLISESVEPAVRELVELACEHLPANVALQVRALALTVRKKIQRPKLEPAVVRERLVEQLTAAGVLRRPRGRSQAWTLAHPDGKPYLAEDGGHQISRAQSERRRLADRTKKAQKRERSRKASEIRAALTGDYSPIDPPDIVTEVELSPGDPPGESPQDAQGDARAASPPPFPVVEAPPDHDPITEPESDLSSDPDLEHQTRPARGHKEIRKIGEATELRSSIVSALRAEAVFLPFAEEVAPRLGQLMKRKSKTLAMVKAAIDEAAEVALCSLNDSIEDPQAWLTTVLCNKLTEMTPGRASEREHEIRKREESTHFRKNARNEAAQMRRREIELRRRADKQRRALATLNSDAPADLSAEFARYEAARNDRLP